MITVIRELGRARSVVKEDLPVPPSMQLTPVLRHIPARPRNRCCLSGGRYHSIVIRKLGRARSVVKEDLIVPVSFKTTICIITSLPDHVVAVVYLWDPVIRSIIRKPSRARAVVKEDFIVAHSPARPRTRYCLSGALYDR